MTPKFAKIRSSTSPREPITVKYCDSFVSQFQGLMLKNSISRSEGILLVQSHESRMGAAIHMFFMRFSIAVIWIDHTFTIVDKKIALPWQPALLPSHPASYILECHPSRINDFQVGDTVELLYE